ncbi:MAG TPA: PEGA domain-containing protein, partial [Polyangia bacterium]
EGALLGDDDLEEIGETQAREAERIAAERAAFKQRIHTGDSGVRQSPEVALEAMTRALRTPEDAIASLAMPPLKRRPPWLVIGTALVVAVGCAAFVILHKSSPAAVTPEPAASAPATKAEPSGPVVTPLEPTAKPETAKPETAAEAKTEPKASAPVAAKSGKRTHKPARHAATASPTVASEPPVREAPKPLAAIQSPDAKRPEPAPVKLEGEGTLLLASSPWCNVKIDGVDKGPTPVSVKLQAGKHTVLLSNPEFKINRSLPVMILPNETTRKRFEF